MNKKFPMDPLQTHKFLFNPLLIFLFFTLKISTTTSYSLSHQFHQIPYSQHCNHIVPESTPRSDTQLNDFQFFRLQNAYFTGGDQIVDQQQKQQQDPYFIDPKSISFWSHDVYRTQDDSVFKVRGTVDIWGLKKFSGNSTNRKLRLVHFRGPRIPIQNDSGFKLTGFWSSTSGKLCMVGSGMGDLRFNVVLKLNYPNSSNIFTSLVNGTLESLDTKGNSMYFDPISILGVSLMTYNYTLIDRENENGGFSVYDNMENVSLGLKVPSEVCSVINLGNMFQLEYMNDCDNSVNCAPFSGSTKNLPSYMSFNRIECLDNGKVRYLLAFQDYGRKIFHSAFDPNTSLLAEGAWDGEKQRLNLVACRILNIRDCSIRLSLSFAARWSLRNRSTVVGRMWSNKSVNDSSYFSSVSLWSNKNKISRGLKYKYEYTEINNVTKSCAKKMTVKGKGGMYPSGYSSEMTFDMTVKNKKGKTAVGFSYPLSVGDKFSDPFPKFSRSFESEIIQANGSNSSLLNISYVMSFGPLDDFKMGGELLSTKSVQISAEGIYDDKTGVLCMIGCRNLKSLPKKSVKDDCQILVNIQYSPLKHGSDVRGTIESTRSKLDPLYFEQLKIYSRSISTSQAKESIWRMDLEITMVLISNTLACLFVGLQLLYVKKHPDVLPFTSVVMLIVLTLAHMIPLLLNFEALFVSNRNRRNVSLGKNGWLEVNEVLVRVITMIAFLLQFRLLQLTWSARFGDGSQKNLQISDKKVLFLSLPLYVGGGLIACFVHLRKPAYRSHFLRQPEQLFWGGLKSYAGLVLDGFLLPQILFNLFSDSKERALSPSFYVGTTVIRLLPHAYDFYRAHSSVWFLDYIYANPRMDYYLPAWDITISCAGLLFASLIYLQQRFRGRCFVPKRFRESSVYEKVPVVNTE